MICCTLREDLLVEVSKLAREGRFDYLLVECVVNTGTGGVIQRCARPRPNDCTLPAAASESSARCGVRRLVPSPSARAELDHDSPSARKASTAACSP
jgi:hypothetical protein